jgi:hypothetical protein
VRETRLSLLQGRSLQECEDVLLARSHPTLRGPVAYVFRLSESPERKTLRSLGKPGKSNVEIKCRVEEDLCRLSACFVALWVRFCCTALR